MTHLTAIGIAWLLVIASCLLISHEGLIDTQATREVFQQAARLTAAAAGEGR